MSTIQSVSSIVFPSQFRAITSARVLTGARRDAKESDNKVTFLISALLFHEIVVISYIGCMTEFCSCRDIDSNPNYVDCEDQFQQIYLVCIGNCAHGDFACLAVCNRDYESSVKDCPCQENCPNGCPCPSYTCQGNGFHKTEIVQL